MLVSVPSCLSFLGWLICSSITEPFNPTDVKAIPSRCQLNWQPLERHWLSRQGALQV